jgi:hypothetical protein
MINIESNQEEIVLQLSGGGEDVASEGATIIAKLYRTIKKNFGNKIAQMLLSEANKKIINYVVKEYKNEKENK